jgi:MFS family permease
MMVLLAPFYGWILDTCGGYVAISIASVACALGCIVRGFATNVDQLYVGTAFLGLGAGNLWTMVT